MCTVTVELKKMDLAVDCSSGAKKNGFSSTAGASSE